jgi:hypothetical protein
MSCFSIARFSSESTQAAYPNGLDVVASFFTVVP